MRLTHDESSDDVCFIDCEMIGSSPDCLLACCCAHLLQSSKVINHLLLVAAAADDDDGRWRFVE